MPRRAIFSHSLLAQVRRYFSLPQWELAAFLGVSAELVKHIEAGRRTLTGPVLLRLNELACWLPADASATPPPPVAPAPMVTSVIAGPEAEPLLARLDVCQHRAGQQRRQLARLEAELAQAWRWEAVLPALLAAAPPITDTSARARQRQRWLAARQQQTADARSLATAARYQLLRVRAEALEMEAAALRNVLALPPPVSQPPGASPRKLH